MENFVTASDVGSPDNFEFKTLPTGPGLRQRRPVINERKEKLILDYRWFDSWLFFCCLLGIPILSWQCYEAVNDSLAFYRFIGWLGAAFVLLSVYYTVATLLNTTAIEVCHQTLSVRHRPLPWFGNKDIDARTIEQIFYTIHYSRHGGRNFSLRALTTNRQQLTLIDGSKNKHEVIRLERAIEKYLGIEDWPRFGE